MEIFVPAQLQILLENFATLFQCMDDAKRGEKEKEKEPLREIEIATSHTLRLQPPRVKMLSQKK